MKKSVLIYFSFLILLVLGACGAKKNKTEESAEENKKKEFKGMIIRESFGIMADGTEVNSYTLTNTNGIEMKVITYGGIITSLKVPDRDGNLEDVVLGYDNLEGYLSASPYFGAIIGRYGNRIANGKFSIDSIEYSLVTNNGKNHLHGGTRGFDKVVWSAKEIQTDNGVALQLNYVSSDMEEGYPGQLDVVVTYTLSDDNVLEFDYKAKTDKRTIVNLTQHSYFNLTALKEDVLKHTLVINADHFLPVDKTLIPTTELKSVEGTPFDFTSPKLVGDDIDSQNQQLTYGGGYDHCWVLNEGKGEMNFAASLYDSASGRFVEIFTTEPGIQFYSGNFLDGSITGKDDIVYTRRMGLCLETQHYPDTPNQPSFPTVLLNPGEEYHTITQMKFTTK